MSNKAKKTSRYNLNATQQLALALLLFVVSVAASRSADMHNWEVSLFSRIYNWPDLLLYPLFIVTQIGSIFFFGACLGILLLTRRYAVATKLLVAGSIAYLASGLAKSLWGRARPTEVIQGIINRDYTVFGPGFPSGHTALATATILVLAGLLPKKLRIFAFVLIILVGLSRIYLGIHAPLDILGGFAIGFGAVALVNHLQIKDIVETRVKKRAVKRKKLAGA